MAAADATGSSYSFKVQCVQQNGEDYVWTLNLEGFKETQCISIYKNGTNRFLTRSLHNHTIVGPAATQEVRAKASLFVASPDEYSFWVYNHSGRSSWSPVKPPVQTGWPVFPLGVFPAIPAQGSGHVGTAIHPPNPTSTTRAVLLDQTSDQAEVAPTLQAETAQPDQAEVAPTLHDDQVPSPGADQVPPVGDAPPEHVDGEDPPTSPADGCGSNERYSIKVVGVEETGGKFEWTLSLNGFERGHFVYIYNNTTDERVPKGLKGMNGHKIDNPAAAFKVSAKAESFDGFPSKRDQYGFR